MMHEWCVYGSATENSNCTKCVTDWNKNCQSVNQSISNFMHNNVSQAVASSKWYSQFGEVV